MRSSPALSVTVRNIRFTDEDGIDIRFTDEDGISIRKRTRGKRIAPIKGTTSSFWMSSILGELKRFTVAMKFNKKIMTNLEDNI